MRSSDLRYLAFSELEQNPTDLNREGFPKDANSDSDCVLGKEASTHGQSFVGGFADPGLSGRLRRECHAGLRLSGSGSRPRVRCALSRNGAKAERPRPSGEAATSALGALKSTMRRS